MLVRFLAASGGDKRVHQVWRVLEVRDLPVTWLQGIVLATILYRVRLRVRLSTA